VAFIIEDFDSWGRKTRGRRFEFSLPGETLQAALLATLPDQSLWSARLSRSFQRGKGLSDDEIPLAHFTVACQAGVVRFALRNRLWTPYLPVVQPHERDRLDAMNGLLLLDFDGPRTSSGHSHVLAMVPEIVSLISGECRKHYEYDKAFYDLKRAIRKLVRQAP
jgi:hypothetical protein